ncbi:LacI family DNA-binding transcriptional regulator [Metarhizobium album]|uniref:LacI family DNA-binding transcriptional regulator n=1 Tax=Metarhizobium album TaxID=2182425 RepID=UPI001FE02D9A|nr:LacI family DNA-binding transcriptional regulator [Rhizobium album]
MNVRRRRSRRDKITLIDVARLVGVSSITVSRALRNPDKVSASLREKILKMVEELGYVPDFAARTLASRDSDVIGVVLPTLSNFALMSVMQGIEERIHQTHYRVQYAYTRFLEAAAVSQIRLFLAQNPAGLIVTGLSPSEETGAILRSADCPVLEVLDISEETYSGLRVGIDTREAARVATRHMLERGYRRFAMVGGPDSRSRLRHAGYCDVMQAAGLYDPVLDIVENEATSADLGCRLLRRLLDRVPDIDGAFCHNDDVALGMMFECRRVGLAVPQQFGLCGFNDLDFAAVSAPTLTSVRVPRYDLGVRAADMIIRAIDNPGLEPLSVDVGFTLVERESTLGRSAG